MTGRIEHTYTLKAPNKGVFEAHIDPQTLAEALSPYNFKMLRASEIVFGAKLHIQTTLLGQKFDWLIEVDEAHENVLSYKVNATEGSWLKLHITERFQPKIDEVEVRYLVEYEAPLMFTPIIKKMLTHMLQAKEEAVKRRFNQLTEVKERKPLTYPLHLFNTLQIIGLILASELLITASTLTPPLSYILALLSWILYWFTPHGLAHYLVGKVLGIRFSHYFIGLSNLYRLKFIPTQLKLMLLTLGIKTESKSLSAASPRAKATMYAAGAVASMALPFTTPIYLLYVGLFNEGVVFLTLSILSAVFSIYFSFRAGDLWKATRALSKEKERFKVL
ncbi:MAG: hypothetical protein QXY08_00560 [Nitrososphaerales archaeon]